MDTTIHECWTLTCRDVNNIALNFMQRREEGPRYGAPPRKISSMTVAGVVTLVHMGKAMQGMIAYIDDGTGIVQCIIPFSAHKVPTASQRLCRLRAEQSLVLGAYVECRGRMGLKKIEGPLYEQFCLNVSLLHVHQDPYAELHHWHVLQKSRDTLFGTLFGTGTLSLVARVCQLLTAQALSAEQLAARLAVPSPVLHGHIVELMENGVIYLDNALNQYKLL